MNSKLDVTVAVDMSPGTITVTPKGVRFIGHSVQVGPNVRAGRQPRPTSGNSSATRGKAA